MTKITTINIDLEKVCNIEPLSGAISGENPIFVAGRNMEHNFIYGWGYAIKLEEALQDVREMQIDLDRYLTAQIAAYMHGMGGRKSPVMVWFTIVGDLILLSLTSRRECSYMEMRNSVDSHSSHILPESSEPFMYYENGCIYRMYFCHSGVDGENNLLFDFGAYTPLRAGNTDEWRYQQIVESPLEDGNIYYSAIPPEADFIVEWENKNITVKRAFCSLRYRGVVSSVEKKEDEYEDEYDD